MRRLSLVLLCFLLVVVGGAAASSRSDAAKTAITPAPAFTADQLAAPAGDNWLSHMASLNGNRYSSLTQVTPANVATLKEAWHINLGTCGDEGRRSAARSSRTRSSTRARTTRRRRRATSSRSTAQRVSAALALQPGVDLHGRGLQRRNRRPDAGRRDRRGQGLRRSP